MKRQPTEEQKARAQERRENFRKLAKQISNMSDEARILLASKLPGVATVEGHALSLHNTCLLAIQKPDATIVGGFRQWIKAGRCVMKGQHGLCIWVPIGKPKANGEATETTSDGNGDDAGRPGFIMGTVFDVSQTQEIETEATQTPAACEGRTIWNSDGTNVPCLICAPPKETPKPEANEFVLA